MQRDIGLYLRDFEWAVHIIELNSEYAMVRDFVVEEVNPSDTDGFFVSHPQMTFLAPSPKGPVLGVNGKTFLVDEDVTVEFAGEGATRSVIIRSRGEPVATFPAPASIHGDPNYGDPELADFFVWLQAGLSRPLFRQCLTRKLVDRFA